MHKDMFSESENKIRFGDYAKNVNLEKYKHLSEVAEYLLQEIEKYPTDACWDLGAMEHPYFSNINFTNYSDFFMMNPLQPELSDIQTREALIYGSNDVEVDFFEIYSKRLKEDNVNKYKTVSKDVKKCKAVVVLPGTSHIDRVCHKKLKYIYLEHGTFAVFKPHPLTEFYKKDYVEHYKDVIDRTAVIADKEDDVYSYMHKADIVYTTHMSETAFHAACLGKRVEPIDLFNQKDLLGFSHVNKHIFEAQDPKYVINKMFNDYRSGIVHPKYQSDWKERISKYLEYIHKKREGYRYKYL